MASAPSVMIRKIKDEPLAMKPRRFLETCEELFQPLVDRPIGQVFVVKSHDDPEMV